MDEKDQKIAELEALVSVLRVQLHNALDAACNSNARVLVLSNQLAAEQPAE